MTPSVLERALGVFCLALLLTVSVLGYRLRSAQGRERQYALHGDSLAAALDTSKRLALGARDSARILGDSLQAVGRRAFQVPQAADALDKALGINRVALAQLAASVRALDARISSGQGVRVDSATGARSATFAIDSEPYRGSVTASLPAFGLGSLDLHIRLDTARLALRLACGAKTDGIRAAQAVLTGPRWLSLELGRVEQAPELCNPLPARPSLLRRLLGSCGVGPAYSVVYAGGRFVGGPGAAASCAIWP